MGPACLRRQEFRAGLLTPATLMQVLFLGRTPAPLLLGLAVSYSPTSPMGPPPLCLLSAAALSSELLPWLPSPAQCDTLLHEHGQKASPWEQSYLLLGSGHIPPTEMQGPGQTQQREEPYSQAPNGPVLGSMELLLWLWHEWLPVSCLEGSLQRGRRAGEVKGL